MIRPAHPTSFRPAPWGLFQGLHGPLLALARRSPDHLAETQGAILPLVPYLDTLRWFLIAVALAGIGIAIYARGWMIGGRAGDDRRPHCARHPTLSLTA